ncbi:VOC family protein [Ottowia thiooxydans]|uniref:VOC family protein n=1 Tax=Ottowia thiooxydans TaxID=219182 RepID=UPI00040CBF75|nr:VOC family protein [Ottowia thiooxydans]
MALRSIARRVLRWSAVGVAGVIVGLLAWSLVVDTQPMHVADDSGDARLADVYLNTPDAQRAANFYAKVFGGTPETAQSTHASLLGATDPVIRVRTPGYAGQAPALAFISRPTGGDRPLGPQDLGYAHLCFEADDVAAVVALIEAHGGKVSSRFDKPARAPVIYATDPDGNTIEVHVPLPSPLTPGTVVRAVRAMAKTYLQLGVPENRVRFLHVNINTPDWKRTLDQYEAGGIGKPTGVQRAYDGDFIGTLTGVPGARVHGRHLALDGYSTGGPTLEVFTYLGQAGTRRLGLADPGVIATGFAATDVELVARRLEAAGFKGERANGSARLMRDGDGNRLLVFPRLP